MNVRCSPQLLCPHEQQYRPIKPRQPLIQHPIKLNSQAWRSSYPAQLSGGRRSDDASPSSPPPPFSPIPSCYHSPPGYLSCHQVQWKQASYRGLFLLVDLPRLVRASESMLHVKCEMYPSMRRSISSSVYGIPVRPNPSFYR